MAKSKAVTYAELVDALARLGYSAGPDVTVLFPMPLTGIVTADLRLAPMGPAQEDG